MSAGKEFEQLIDVMAALRKGCPWDREQTHASLGSFLIEEAYEVIDAIDEEDPKRLKEELGDLLLQIVFHSQIAAENDQFDSEDVVRQLTKKLRDRHPHVFGNVEVETARDVLVNWEELKKQEGKGKRSILEGLPRGLPALLWAHRLQERVARQGLAWKTNPQLLETLENKLGELKKSLDSDDKTSAEGKTGDILFSLVNISWNLGFNPEDTLRKTIKKFTGRFQRLEEHCRKRGVKLSDITPEEFTACLEEEDKTM